MCASITKDAPVRAGHLVLAETSAECKCRARQSDTELGMYAHVHGEFHRRPAGQVPPGGVRVHQCMAVVVAVTGGGIVRGFVMRVSIVVVVAVLLIVGFGAMVMACFRCVGTAIVAHGRPSLLSVPLAGWPQAKSRAARARVQYFLHWCWSLVLCFNLVVLMLDALFPAHVPYAVVQADEEVHGQCTGRGNDEHVRPRPPMAAVRKWWLRGKPFGVATGGIFVHDFNRNRCP